MTSIDDAIGIIKKYAGNALPKVGMILGSGMAPLADQIVNPVTIPYQALGLAAGTVMGHASLMVFGTMQGVPVMCLKGRLHLYEGATYESIRTMVRLVKLLGAHSLIVTCAVGSLNPQVGPGEIMLLNDHINLQSGNPLLGPNDESFGPRFPEMDHAYDPYLRQRFQETAKRLNIPCGEGVYISVMGPSFETPAEIRAFRTLGADMVGMSVVPEVIVARHCGLRVLGVAAITNLASGLSQEAITHEGTLQYADIAARKLVKIIPEFMKDAGAELSA